MHRNAKPGKVIKEALRSMLSQTYPKDKVSVIIVDGGSSDGTVETCRRMLQDAGLASYEIIVQKSTIPEARNTCISRADGEYILFWDSDIIMRPDSLEKLVRASSTGMDILSADVKFTRITNFSEGWSLLETYSAKALDRVEKAPAVTMSATLIRRSVAENVKFDPDLTLYEDMDFCMRAARQGYTIAVHRGVVAVDLNPTSEPSSDIFTGKPLHELTRGLRKKARAKIYALSPDNGLKGFLKYAVKTRRHGFYLGYTVVLPLLAYSILAGNLLLTIPPAAYILGYASYQIKSRGLRQGLKVLALSFLVGLPLSLLMLYYAAKNSLRYISGRVSWKN